MVSVLVPDVLGILLHALAVKDRTRVSNSLASSFGFFSMPPACANSIPSVSGVVLLGVVTVPFTRTGVGLTISPLEVLVFDPFDGVSLVADFYRKI